MRDQKPWLGAVCVYEREATGVGAGAGAAVGAGVGVATGSSLSGRSGAGLAGTTRLTAGRSGSSLGWATWGGGVTTIGVRRS